MNKYGHLSRFHVFFLSYGPLNYLVKSYRFGQFIIGIQHPNDTKSPYCVFFPEEAQIRSF